MSQLPEPLRGSEEGSFAQDTVTRRLPETAQRVLLENDWEAEQRSRLETLRAEMPLSRLRSIQDPGAPDERVWNRALRPYLQQNWLEAPWFVAETYFFRRVIEATGYYQPGVGLGKDPFTWQKQQGWEAAQGDVQKAAGKVHSWLKGAGEARVEHLVELLKTSLWGNQVDLSLWPAEQDERPDHADVQQGEAFLLCDQAAQAAAYLTNLPPGQVDILVDNAGQELAMDLLLAAYLLSSKAARRVVLHLKPHPTFVSDATVPDVLRTVTTMSQSPGQPMQVSGKLLEKWVAQRRLVLKPDYFWTSPHPAWDMPARLRHKLAGARLVISKGDANYRRLLGDRHWSFTTPFEQAVGYFPAPLLALRAAKSNVMVGLKPGQEAALAERDAKWMYSGRWGLIQFLEKNHA